eukprot:Skav214770  [mRNA]  locus=scaffold3923:3129:3698:- [translate_table: standard]
MTVDYQERLSEMKGVKSKREAMAKKAATAAKAKAKAEAKKAAGALKRQGNVRIRVRLPNGHTVVVTLDKGLTIGQIRHAILGMKNCAFDMGKGKNKKKLDTVALVTASGKNIAEHPRAAIYNNDELMHDLHLTAMWVTDFNANPHVPAPAAAADQNEENQAIEEIDGNDAAMVVEDDDEETDEEQDVTQ